MSGVLLLVAARARQRPGRWMLPALGIALAVAFAGAILVEGTVAGTQAARATLVRLSPLDRAVQIGWEGPVTPQARQAAVGTLRRLGLPAPSRVTLLNPVRLDGTLVRLAAITPLARWAAPARSAPCRSADCPMLLAGGAVPRSALSARGVRIGVVGRTQLHSAAALGFLPGAGAQLPLLLSGDAAGLEQLGGLGGVYRSHTWVSLLPADRLTSWQLAPTERRLQRAQARLLATSSQFSFSGPFDGLSAARASAETVPRRLLLAAGGAVTALLMFVALAAGGLRADQSEELARLRRAGAPQHYCLLFVVGEAVLISLVAVVVGAALALVAGSLLANAAAVPVSGALLHSVLTPLGVGGVFGSWVGASLLLSLLLLSPAGSRISDALAFAAVCALAFALLADQGNGGVLALALAPLCCLAAGVIIARSAGLLLRLGERVVRPGPVLGRLAVVGLARSPSAPSLAIAFLAVSTGLGGFALTYRATLSHSTVDQAAQQVPLTAIVGPTANFAPPLALAPLAEWETISRGSVLPVRRTQASFVSGGASRTVTALGVPASALPAIHGWRSGQLSVAPPTLAHRLAPPGPVRAPGPGLPPGRPELSLAVASPALPVSVTAELRDGSGDLTALDLGVAGRGTRAVRRRLPAGRWELAAIELSEPTGLQATNGHQNAESPGGATQASDTVRVGPVRALGPGHRVLLAAGLSQWRGVGAATSVPVPGRARGRPDQRNGAAVVRFAESGVPGILRPAQPSDARPLPVLVDPQTAQVAGPSRRLALTIDGLPVTGRVVGVADRFPTVAAGAAGFIVADEARLASALEAQLPGQGRPDELWFATRHANALRRALRHGQLAQLHALFRADIERRLGAAPVARAVLGTLAAAATLAGALALVGLLVVLLGAMRDRRVEADLRAQGIGPRGLRVELRLRLLVASLLGVAGGLLVATVLGRLAVSAVQAAGVAGAPDPPVVAVEPAGLMLVWALAAVAGLTLAGWLATLRLGPGVR